MNEKNYLSLFVIICLILLLLIGAGYVIKYFLLPVKTVTSQIAAASDIIDKTYTADNAIYNYEWFKTQYEKIDANRKQVQNTIATIADFKNTYGDITSWDYETKQEYNRLNTIKLGLQNQDNTLVAEYNARSKMANKAIFKDKLPLNVERMLW